jgi:outer membrane protein TolC
MAKEGLAAEAEKAWADARDARDRMKAAREGQRQAKAWLAAVMQSEEAGLAETRDLADALLQYFMMKARLIQATFDWDVGVVGLQRAMGQRPGELRFVEGD